MHCPSCAKVVQGEFQFCPHCAAPLRGRQPRAGAEERKVVSVLFCDLVGFTASADGSDPEDVRARIRPYHAQMRHVVEHHGGTVEKFVGDAVMAVFGAPVAHEDDAERAVRAGLRMLEAIEDLNDADPGLAFHVRIGINTGEVVVSLGAWLEHGEGIVTGDVVNTAARLQGVAPVDGIAVSDQTFRHTERIFDYEPLDAVAVKGKAEALSAHRPVRPRARLGTDPNRTRTTPFVGRELEKALLISTFERAAGQRTCQLVTVVGEPGVGKSRLCDELGSYLDERPGLVRWRQGRCLPYGEGIAFWALGEIVKAECGILESDSPQEAAEKLDRALDPTDSDLPWLKARLAPLVGAGSEPASQEESFTAWRRFVESLAADAPTVLVFEDLHWADPAMLAFLAHLADWAEGVPLLVLCTARPELPEQHPTWAAGVRNAISVNLPPLTDEETATLLATLLRDAVLPPATQRALLERADGNPLYAEEFARLLFDRHQLVGVVDVPDSVQALIAARLDTLTADRKSLLQDAAVVGKVFWSGVLQTMGGRTAAQVEQALHELSRKELVRPARTSSMAGEQEYEFWHVLIRDVCYQQLPRAERASRHRAGAAWIEQQAGERVEDIADVLANHYLLALELTRAAGDDSDSEELEDAARRFLALAGERAAALDIDAAEASLARALQLTPPGHPDRARLLERWGDVARQQGRLQETRTALEEALEICHERDDAVAVGRVLTALADTRQKLGDAGASHVIAEAIAVLEAEPPSPELVAAYASLAGFFMLSGDYRPAANAAGKGLALSSELGLPEPARALGHLGGAHCELGDSTGLEEMRRALALALDQGKSGVAAILYNNLALETWLYDGPQRALELCREGLDFCERRGIVDARTYIAGTRLTPLAAGGQPEQALADAEWLATYAEAAGDLPSLNEARSQQLRLLTELGRHEDAPRGTEELLTMARETGEPQNLANTCAAGALVLLAEGNLERAGELLAEVDGVPATRNDPYYAANLAGLVRCALALDDAKLAARLVDGVEPRVPIQEHALASCQAQLAEALGEHAAADPLYAEAAERWGRFGDVPEQAYALLGQGRCRVELGHAEATEPLGRARHIFESLGYRPALDETDALLAVAAQVAT